MDGLQLEGWPADRTLTLSGAPRTLRLPVTLTNPSARPVAVAEVSLAEVRLGGDGAPLRTEPAPVGLVAPANGALAANIRLRLDRATPPGRYSGQISLAGQTRPVEIEVAPDTALAVRPDPVVVDAALGRSARVVASFENKGNTSLTLDLAGRYRLGEELPLGTRRPRSEDGAPEIVRALLDLIPGLARRPALLDVGEVELSMPDGPVALPPGGAETLAVDVALPERLSPTARYHVFAPVYAAELHIVVVTAAKPGAAPSGRARRASRRIPRTQGRGTKP
jgi:hypothetical protein